MKRTTLIILISMLVAAANSLAQGPMPTPGPELKKLDYFAGSWKSEAELKSPGGGSPGAKMTGTDKIEWMQGNFFLVIRSSETVQGLQIMATGYMGYNAEDKAYTIDLFNSLGDAEHSKGKIDGNTWTFAGPGKNGDQTRYTITVVSPNSYKYKFEVAAAGSSDYSILAEGTKTRVSTADAPKGTQGAGARTE